jgi:hypothetical protein
MTTLVIYGLLQVFFFLLFLCLEMV